MKTESLNWRQRAEQLLAETKHEIAQLTGPDAKTFAESIRVSLVGSYLETMRAQEKRLERELNM